MAEVNGVKWQMGIPKLIVIVSLIVALATTLAMKASSTSVVQIVGRVGVLESQYTAMMASQADIKSMLKEIDIRQREANERLARIEEAYGIKK